MQPLQLSLVYVTEVILTCSDLGGSLWRFLTWNLSLTGTKTIRLPGISPKSGGKDHKPPGCNINMLCAAMERRHLISLVTHGNCAGGKDGCFLGSGHRRGKAEQSVRHAIGGQREPVNHLSHHLFNPSLSSDNLELWIRLHETLTHCWW